MTTSVKVTAHCASDKQVRIVRWSTQGGQGTKDTETVIQDGETNEQVVYDDWQITVYEEVKST